MNLLLTPEIEAAILDGAAIAISVSGGQDSTNDVRLSWKLEDFAYPFDLVEGANAKPQKGVSK